MLTPAEFDAYCQRLNFFTAARALMQTIRTSPPSRRVRSAAGNVSVHSKLADHATATLTPRKRGRS